MLADAPTTLLDVRGAKPWEALCRLRDTLPANSVDRKAWASRARIAAIMGSCPKSLDSFKSGAHLRQGATTLMVQECVVTGLRHWIGFAKIFYGSGEGGFPPTMDGLICWSHTFRQDLSRSAPCQFYPWDLVAGV